MTFSSDLPLVQYCRLETHLIQAAISRPQRYYSTDLFEMRSSLSIDRKSFRTLTSEHHGVALGANERTHYVHDFLAPLSCLMITLDTFNHLTVGDRVYVQNQHGRFPKSWMNQKLLWSPGTMSNTSSR